MFLFFCNRVQRGETTVTFHYKFLEKSVSILVIVEWGFEHFPAELHFGFDISFNPCYNGMGF